MKALNIILYLFFVSAAIFAQGNTGYSIDYNKMAPGASQMPRANPIPYAALAESRRLKAAADNNNIAYHNSLSDEIIDLKSARIDFIFNSQLTSLFKSLKQIDGNNLTSTEYKQQLLNIDQEIAELRIEYLDRIADMNRYYEVSLKQLEEDLSSAKYLRETATVLHIQIEPFHPPLLCKNVELFANNNIIAKFNNKTGLDRKFVLPGNMTKLKTNLPGCLGSKTSYKINFESKKSYKLILSFSTLKAKFKGKYELIETDSDIAGEDEERIMDIINRLKEDWQ